MKVNRRRGGGRRRAAEDFVRVNPHAAGIDCGSREHYAAVPPDRDAQPVRAFPVTTDGLYRLATWLQACGVTTVAMEATGVYWIPLYEVLEERGLTVCLVNARHVNQVPGRKSDVQDCEWLRYLHTVGLLRASFRPTGAIVALRSYQRHRDQVVQDAAAAVQRMQKALLQMNLQLPLVVSDITGVTGQRILRAIVAGERDPQVLAQYRDTRCHATEADIVSALTGHWRPEHLFALTQQLAAFDFYQQQLAACDAALAGQLAALTAACAPPATPLPAPRTRRRPRDNEPTFEIRSPLHQLTGVDLSQIDGIGPASALRLISEIGTDMSRWATEKHFTAWLTLAPQNKRSGGRLLSSRTQPSANRAAHVLRVAAMSVGRTDTALGAFYRRLGHRQGKPIAITATARKLAILVYRMLKDGLVYRDPGAAAYTHQQRGRVLKRLSRHAATLGFSLVNLSSGEVIQSAVS